MSHLIKSENKSFLAACNRWLSSALRFLGAVAALDANLLQAYLDNNPEYVMLFKGRRP